MAEATRVRSQESTQSGRDLKKGEYGYPAGHLGHLTESQAEALVNFKKLVTDKGLVTEAKDGVPASHDDVTLLRYLRARRFVPADALQQFQATEDWRKTNEIDNLYQNIDVHEYNETWKLYPQWTGRRDKRGLPVYVFEVAPLNAKRMAEYAKSAQKTTVLNSQNDHSGKAKGSVPAKLYRLFALYENLVNFALPMCTALRDRPLPRTPISQANNIVDISGVGLKQFWNLRAHMQDASVLATANYPETLDRIFIVGAPAFFPTVWEWIKRWFDPITVSKIFILSEAHAFKTLSAFIDPANIPKKYGGTLEYVFGGGPVLEEHIAARFTFLEPDASWPLGPIRFERTTDPDQWNLLAVGSSGGKERRQVVAKFAPDPVPAPENEERVSMEGPDRSIDFATRKIVINSRTSLATTSAPPSPTLAKHPSDGSRPLSQRASKELFVDARDGAGDAEKEALGNGTEDAAATVTTPRAAADGAALTEKSGNLPPGDASIFPPASLEVNKAEDVPVAATTTPLPDPKAGETKA